MKVLKESDSGPDVTKDAFRKKTSRKWWRWAKAKDETCHQEKSKMKDTKRIESSVSFLQLYSFADKFDYLLMFIGSIGAAGHGVGLPLILVFLGDLLNGIGNATNVQIAQQTVNKNTLYFVWIAIACLGSSWIEISFWMHTGHRQAAKMRLKYIEALLRQDVVYFDVETSTGEIVNSLATDTFAVQDAISEKTGHCFHHVATFLASYIIGFSTQWRVTVITVSAIPCIALTGGIYAYFLTRYTTRSLTVYSEAGSIAQQAISQVRTVYSFVAEENSMKSYSAALRKNLKLGVKTGLVKGIGLGITMLLMFCCYAGLLTYGGVVVRKGEGNGGEVLATILNVVMGTLSLAQAMANLTPFGKARASALKIFQAIHHENFINKPNQSAQTPKMVDGHIEFRKVEFSYPARPDVPIFRNFSLIVPTGKSVAIVGSSGSGKSTVVTLIERFYDPSSGEVLLDGLDLRKLDLKWLRRQIGLVNQEPALFATTVAANIGYGSDSASEKEIEEAAKVANADSFISQLPNGYQTLVGERGVQLSGGQRQRIAIARTVIRNPRVLLLDEATSALDAGSEQVVQEALDQVRVGRTTVIVAHRLSTIRDADIIVVLERGRILESGTHQDLISREDGAYNSLVLLQVTLAATNEVTAKDVILEETSSSQRLSPGYSNRDGGRLLRHQSEPLTLELQHQSSPPTASIDGIKRAHQSDQQSEEAVLEPKGSIKRLIAMSKVDWKYGVGAIVGSIGAGWVGPLTAVILATVLVDYYHPDQHRMKRDIEKLSLLFVALGCWTLAFYSLQHFALGILGEKLVTRVREKLFAKILRNELGWFDEPENNSNQLAACLASNAGIVRTVVGDRVSVLLQTATMLIVSSTISFVLQWKLTLVMEAAFPLITGACVFEHWMLTTFAKQQAKLYERATQVVGEAVSNIRTVAAFCAEDKVQALFNHELVGTSKQSFRKGHVAGFGYGVSQFFSICSMAVGLWYAGHLVISGESAFPQAIKVFLIMVISSFSAADAFSLGPDLVKGGHAVASLFKIMDRETKIEPDGPEGEKIEKIRGDIELKEVTFAYPSRLNFIVFRSMDLKVMSGHSLALVGPSGSGKSSIITLIERFYDPLSGVILIDGIDIKNYNLRFLRRHIALVQQEPALFATTIYENIIYGKANANEAEVIEAAKAANAHQFISSLPEGYKTMVGERGTKLSGGQKQRIAVARAIIKDPTIFLLDEATSALDAESEKVVQGAIDRLMEGRTTVMVAHRLSTIRHADSIAVVQDGKICEQGSHLDLLSREGGAYCRLIRLQQQAEKL